MSNSFGGVCTCVRDAELRHIPSGQAVLIVTVANNQGFGDKQSTLFIRCSVWGKKAESKIIDYLKKGQQVFVSGELRQQEYEKDGITQTSLELNCNIIDLVGGQRNEQPAPQPAAQSQHHTQKANAYQPQKTQASNNAPPYDDFDDDIPF